MTSSASQNVRFVMHQVKVKNILTSGEICCIVFVFFVVLLCFQNLVTCRFRLKDGFDAEEQLQPDFEKQQDEGGGKLSI